jgi:PAS domain S-box-containing protein
MLHPARFTRMSPEVRGRQHVEAALSDGEASFQAIFDHAALGIAQIGLDKSWMRVNNRFCEMLGYSEAELRTKTLGDITHSDYAEESRAARQQLLAGEISSHTMDKLYIRKDGTVFWGRLNRSLVRDSDGQPQYIIAVVEDITDKIDAEHALRDSEQRLILAQKAAHVGVCEWDLRTNVLTHSEEYARLYGLAPDHPPLTLEELLKRTHPDDRQRVQASLKNALERTHAWDTEHRVVWPDGSAHWLHSKGVVFLDASGRPVRSMGVVFNVTARKRAQAALHRSQVQYRELFEHMNEGLAYCKMLFENGIGSDFIFLVVNPRFEVLTGLKDVIGKRATEVLPRIRDLDPGELEVYGRVAQTGTPVRFEKFINVFQQWFAVSAYSPEQGFVGLVFDVITERKRLERIAEANRKEIQALAASLMTAQEDERRKVSRDLHDGMCQELGSLAIEIGRLAAHLPSREDMPSQLRALQARVDKASVEARNIAYQLRPPELDLGLPIALQDLCNQFAERAPGMTLEYMSGTLPESVPLEVTSCVYRVAQESLYNTVKHSRAKNASVILTWRQGAIELTVADDGDGFDWQSVQGKGGLGLIGMEERARLVNGKLTITSQPGSGTRIALDVPLAPTPALAS